MITDSDRVYPTPRGVRPLPALVQAYPPLPTLPCVGMYMARYLDNSVRLYAGSRTKLYRGVSGAWLDYSPTQTFDTQPNDRWRWAQFGNDTLAVNGRDVPQFITLTGSQYVPLAGNPPVAKIVAALFNFTFLLNLSDPAGLAALTPTMWWCSGIGNNADWTPAIATQCVNGYLDDTPGEIVGAKPIGRNLAVYKLRSTYSFEYVGAPEAWRPRLTSANTGAASHEAIVDLGDAHVYPGYDAFYLNDGSGPPQRMDAPITRWFYELGDLNWAYSWAICGNYNHALNCVFWHYPSKRITQQTDPVTLDAYLIWNRSTNVWLRGEIDITSTVDPEILIDLGVTYGEFGTPYAAWDDIVGVHWNDFIFFGSTNTISGVVLPDGSMWTYSGEADPAAFIDCGDFGDGTKFQFIRGIRPQYAVAPQVAGARLDLTLRRRLGDPPTTGRYAYLNQGTGNFDIRSNAIWTRPKITFGCDSELFGYEFDHDEMGVR